ncbi:hypothetical protein ACTU44_08305 [Thalassospira sp. SM2505]
MLSLSGVYLHGGVMVLILSFRTVALTIVVIVCGVFSITTTMASEPAPSGANRAHIRVGNVVHVTPTWLSTLSSQQARFYNVLVASPDMDWHDGMPFDRMMSLYDQGNLDCIVAEGYRALEGTIISRHDVLFELVIFGRTGDTLLDRNVITVGYLATLPKLEMPFAQPIEWYGLRTIRQGAELVRVGRIDVLVAHAGLFDEDPLIEQMPFPPVHVVVLTLQCHDTPENRSFLSSFDRRMDTERERVENLPGSHQLLRHFMSY